MAKGFPGLFNEQFDMIKETLMNIFDRFRRVQPKKKKIPAMMRQVIELHVREDDFDDEALKKNMLYEALSVFNATDSLRTVVNLMSLYKAMEKLVEAKGLTMEDISPVKDGGGQHFGRSRFSTTGPSRFPERFRE